MAISLSGQPLSSGWWVVVERLQNGQRTIRYCSRLQPEANSWAAERGGSGLSVTRVGEESARPGWWVSLDGRSFP